MTHHDPPEATQPPTVAMRDVVVLLGRFPALAGFDLEVARGEVVLLSGPNGAGKTTVLRTCAGLAAPVSGEASVLGLDLHTQRSAVRRRVGMVGHASGLYEELSVLENMDFFAGACGASGTEARAALERLGVATRLGDVPVGALSSGQKRRVSFAAMLVRRPELWLLDEPHSGLDQAGRDLVDGLLSEAAGAGATVLFASHELDRAEGVSHRSVVVTAGMAGESGG
ncbi:MAG: heme ABC exporter ATP-binding protein CcmA [Microthrixaceae bacterium]|nr:heme ABC exporter ATP-binding protein CcmA [Microthrixaceae bacterium]